MSNGVGPKGLFRSGNSQYGPRPRGHQHAPSGRPADPLGHTILQAPGSRSVATRPAKGPGCGRPTLQFE